MTGDAHGVRLKAIRAELARNSYCFGELASDSVITSLGAQSKVSELCHDPQIGTFTSCVLVCIRAPTIPRATDASDADNLPQDELERRIHEYLWLTRRSY